MLCVDRCSIGWHRCSGLMFHIGYDRRYVVDRCSGLIGVL